MRYGSIRSGSWLERARDQGARPIVSEDGQFLFYAELSIEERQTGDVYLVESVP